MVYLAWNTFSIAEAGVPYNISVAAVNSKGVGELTSRISFTRELGKLVD